MANGLIVYFISGNPAFRNGSRSGPTNPSDCIVLDISVFDNLISVDKQFAKALPRFTTYQLVNNNLWEKFVSSSPTIFDDSLKATSDSFFIADFNLLSCEFDSFTFKLLYCVIFILIRIKLIQQNRIYKTFTVPCENSKTVSFASSRMK